MQLTVSPDGLALVSVAGSDDHDVGGDNEAVSVAKLHMTNTSGAASRRSSAATPVSVGSSGQNKEWTSSGQLRGEPNEAW